MNARNSDTSQQGLEECEKDQEEINLQRSEFYVKMANKPQNDSNNKSNDRGHLRSLRNNLYSM